MNEVQVVLSRRIELERGQGRAGGAAPWKRRFVGADLQVETIIAINSEGPVSGGGNCYLRRRVEHEVATGISKALARKWTIAHRVETFLRPKVVYLRRIIRQNRGILRRIAYDRL